MIKYPTDPVALAALTDREWDILLKRVWNAPVPRHVVRLIEYREPSRRDAIMRLRADGLKGYQIAERLNISASMVSLILNGKRD